MTKTQERTKLYFAQIYQKNTAKLCFSASINAIATLSYL
jgi:hypothetical protein